jgi:hypothetical protein
MSCGGAAYSRAIGLCEDAAAREFLRERRAGRRVRTGDAKVALGFEGPNTSTRHIADLASGARD